MPEDVRTRNLQKNAARSELLYSINLAINLPSKHLLSIYYMEDVLSPGNMSKKALSLSDRNKMW